MLPVQLGASTWRLVVTRKDLTEIRPEHQVDYSIDDILAGGDRAMEMALRLATGVKRRLTRQCLPKMRHTNVAYPRADRRQPGTWPVSDNGWETMFPDNGSNWSAIVPGNPT